MTDQPLQPFLVPHSLLSYLPAGISEGTLVQWFLLAVFVYWLVYTLIAVYHWLKYSHGAIVSYPAIALHVFMSVGIMAYALSGTIIIHA